MIKSIAPETDVQAIRSDQSLRAQIDLDSMDWLNVIAGLCDGLSIEIPESDHGRLTTLDSIVAYVASRPAASPRRTAAAPDAPCAGPPSSRYVINGTPVTIRPIRPDDLPLEADFVRHLSQESRYNRFLVTVSELSDRKLHYFTEVDQVSHVALAAMVEHEGRQAMVGVVRYIVDPAGSGCEFAIALDDAWQGSGLAGILMQVLIGVARSRRLTRMEGTVLAINTRMLRFIRQLGFVQTRDAEDRESVRVVLWL